MWEKPWRLREGLCIGCGLLLTGLLLQFAAGPINWDLFAWPANAIAAAVFVFVSVVAHLLRRRSELVRFHSTAYAAASSLLFAVGLTALMGFTRQVPAVAASTHSPADLLGLTYMLGFWPFVLIYLWMALILALTLLKRLSRPSLRDIPFVLNHLGLLVVVVCGTLGSADMQRLRLTAGMEFPEWRAVNDRGQMRELPIAVQLEQFKIEEYPAKVLLANHRTGHIVSAQPEVNILKTIDKAAPVATADSTWYVDWPSNGAVTALYVEAAGKRGWLSGGSYLFPTQMLTLNDSLSLAMAEREPKAFVSTVHIYTKTGKNIRTSIEVNKPFEVDGWKIYQLDYDHRKGRWSDVSVLEFVSDPWLPVVYAGVGMMLLGALCLFVYAPRGRRKEEQQ